MDAALRNEARRFALSESILNSEDDNDVANNDDVIGSPETTDDSISLDTLHLAFSIIKNKWAQSDCRNTKDIPSLVEPWHAHGAPEPNPVFDDVLAARDDDHALGASPDFRTVRPHTLQQWQNRLASAGSDDLSGDLDADSGVEDCSDSGDDSNPSHHLPLGVDNDQNPLIPITDNSQSEVDPTILDWISRIGPSPTGSRLTELIQESLPLNRKQRLVVQKVLAHAIKHQGKSTVEAQDQMLLYIAGDGGVGKTQVIKAITLEYELLE